MNLKDYLRNPGGKGNAALGQGNIIDSLDRKYAILLTGKKKFECTVYKVNLKDIYYIHVKVPSESDRDNSYDVVIKLTNENGTNSSTVDNYEVRFFCNSPSFVYTFARAYKVNNLFVDELANKLPKESTRKDSEVRNVYGIINYDKYIYFACRYLYDHNYLQKDTLNSAKRTYSKTALEMKVRTFDKVMKEYKIADKKAKDAKQRGTEYSKKKPNKIKRFDEDSIHKVKKVKQVKKVNGKSKKPKQVKSINKK